MRIGMMSYPMLFQRSGGLQVQIRETLAALHDQGIAANLVDWRHEQLSDFDVIHVFGAINGNHRIVEAARQAKRPIVLSSVLSPPFTRFDRYRAELARRVTGRLTRWQTRTSYDEVVAALQNATRVVALGQQEKLMLREGYSVPADQVSVIGNGVSDRFFRADPKLFRDTYEINARFVLCCASISPYKNQLRLCEAAAASRTSVVLIGRCAREQAAYLDRCLTVGRGYASYLGELNYDSDTLASAYAAADGFALVSQAEVAPLVVLESLASGTPVIMTSNHSLDIGEEAPLKEVAPTKGSQIEAGLHWLMRRAPDADTCRAAAEPYRWHRVANSLVGEYRALTCSGRI